MLNTATDDTPGAMLEWDEATKSRRKVLPVAVPAADPNRPVNDIGIVRRDHVEDGTAGGWLGTARRQFLGEDSFVRYREVTQDWDDDPVVDLT